VLPYFKRCESFAGGGNEWRGADGPLGTEFARTSDPLYDAWIEAAALAGVPHTSDYNAASQEGFGRSQYTIRDGRRSSAARAFLRPAMRRKNLRVATGALVTRITLQGTAATGIEYVRRGQLREAAALREVIVAGGAFSTPQILMLSGIGPAAHLREVGIALIVDLPVGRNLQDHLAVFLSFTRREPGPFHAQMRFDRMAAAMVRAYLFGTGPGTVVPGGLHAFIKARPDLVVPDIEFMFRGTAVHPHLWFPAIRPAYRDGFAIRPTLLHPMSRGEVTLRSADPRDRMRIRYNFFSAPGDLANLREGFRIARDLRHARARRGAPACGGRFGDAGPRLRPPQRCRHDDGRKGRRPDRKGAMNRCLARSPESTLRRGMTIQSKWNKVRVEPQLVPG
jgi:4-pyridoxate dehydrogenase